MEPTLLDLDEPGHLFGRATLPNGARVVCGTWVSRQAPVEGVDWVGLYLPLGALGRADERVGAFPFLGPGSSRSWREPIDQWFVDVARRVRAVTAFRVGLIGEEASALDTRWDGTVPAQRAIGYVVPTDTSLRYLPTNQWDVEI